MHTDTHTGLDSPEGHLVEARPPVREGLGRHRLRLVHGAVRDDAALALEGRPEPVRHPRARRRPTPTSRACSEFVKQYKVGEENGIPIVAPPPGRDVYLLALACGSGCRS